MEVTTDRRSVQQCLEQRYSLPSYQRDYKWEVKHLRDLLEDIQESFLENYEPTHGRANVSEYSKYFLGTIITITGGQGRRAIIDGQQRITTLALLAAYFLKMKKATPDLGISDIASLLRKSLFGKNEYNIDFPVPREAFFNLIIESGLDGQALEDAVDSIPNIDTGTRQLFSLFNHIHDCITSEIAINVIPFFVDYLTQCVQLFEIGVPSEQDGHKVFVTMNDRGLKLGPMDLLKGYLLSHITHDESNKIAHTAWMDLIAKLQQAGSDEDSAFFKNWLRSQHAQSIRGKQKGAAAGDFELVSDGYHRWVEDNSQKLVLANSDDYIRLVKVTLPFYGNNYLKILSAESKIDTELPYVFYNGNRDLTLQSMVILAALDSDDTEAIVKTKISLVSYYLDCFANYRIMNKQDNTYNNLRDPLFELTKQLRRKNITEIVSILEANFDMVFKTPFNFSSINYGSGAEIVLHFLSRLADFLEQELGLTNNVGFPNYVQRKKTNDTFDIEHLLPAEMSVTRADLGPAFDFSDEAEYMNSRNSFGGLILLSRGRNRSLKAMPLSKKIVSYATEGVLAQSFTQSFYMNNPQAVKNIARLKIDMFPVTAFNKTEIDRRTAFYGQLAGLIWRKTRFAEIAKSHSVETN